MVLGTQNPADMMTKYLDRTCIDKCMKYLSQDRADGRAKSGLEVQGADHAGSTGAAPAESSQKAPMDSVKALRFQPDVVIDVPNRKTESRAMSCRLGEGSPPPRPPSRMMWNSVDGRSSPAESTQGR